MSAKKKETAEQKLLKMIEATSGGAAMPKSEQKITKQQNAVSWIKSINKLLFIVTIAAALFMANEFVAGEKLLSKIVDFSVSTDISFQARNPQLLMPIVQKLSFYQALTKKRNILRPFETEKIPTSSAVTERNLQIVQETKNLKLVGISWLDTVDTASVMIEDTDRKVTYFLNKNESIGNIIVKTIYADSAVLGYDNEEITIKYDKNQ